MNMPPSLSVVVIGRNEGERLVRCLQSIRLATAAIGSVEIIYVDSASHDGSPDRARSFGANVITVRPTRPSAAIGRNAGWRSAAAENVLFLDGDTLLEPGFVERAVAEFEDPTVAVVWGHRREVRPEASVYNRVMDLDWIYPPGPSDFCGGDALMRRKVLEAVGGFSEELIAGEEPELCQRIRARGLTILHVDQPMTRHDLAIERWPAYWKRAVRAGYAYAEVSQRLKHTAFPLWLRDARRNLIHAAVLLALGGAAPVMALLVGAWWPILLAATLALGLVLRSAYKARWKSRDLLTLVCYGVHSHLQQIPIALGQLSYWWDHWRGQPRFLIEYK
ncbi:glycosyltransferase [Methylotetracoccus oryzae]|uniref:glycosyltransferase n=1 Tax=Methylotetracoccus oryzae TaxID=1919059 RepID=UPI00111AEC7E|nr:glycosyltransferase [Methylotetracoccus oryzae]